MKNTNALAERLALKYPIIQAPMAGGGDTVELVAAVSNAGALGSVGAAYLSPQQIVERGKAIRAKTSRPFGTNLFAPAETHPPSADAVQRAIESVSPYYAELGIDPPILSGGLATFDDQLAACLETGAAVFSFTFGLIPKPAVSQIKSHKVLVVGTATTVAEAKALADLGVDAVVAQGSEAGGHRGTFLSDFTSGMIGTMALVPQVVDAVSIPVIASGGIMDGRGVAAALALGAAGVQLGTAFLTCAEAGVPEAYKDAILSAPEDSTRITRAFSGRPARGIANRFLTGMQSVTEVLPFPLQNAITRPMRAESSRQNRADYLSLWAGQGTRMARRITANELVERLVAETDSAIGSLSSWRPACP